jgi:hypothetical protein
LFSRSPEHSRNPSAAAFLRRERSRLRQPVARWTREHAYTIDQVVDEMIERCRKLDLRLAGSEDAARHDALIMLTVQTMNYLHGGHYRVAL